MTHRKSRPQSAVEPRMQVVNRTRDTVLAVSMEVADHGDKRRTGLLGRNALDAGGGLWIAPCEAVHTFFMRFAIDLVYLDRKRRVRKVKHAVAPWRISACLTAHSVLELPAGTVLESQTRSGDLIDFLPADPGSET